MVCQEAAGCYVVVMLHHLNLGCPVFFTSQGDLSHLNGRCHSSPQPSHRHIRGTNSAYYILEYL